MHEWMKLIAVTRGTQEPQLGNRGPAPSLRDTPGLVSFRRDMMFWE